MNARQLCRWAAMQHPDAEVRTDATTLYGEAYRLFTQSPGDEPDGLPVEVEGPSASAFENGKKEKPG